jgi:hypothetical protein
MKKIGNNSFQASGHDSQNIVRYKQWLSREAVAQPMFGLLWEPDLLPPPAFIESLGYGVNVSPEQIHPETFLPEIERWYQRCVDLSADAFQPFSPSFGIPWVEAIIGCPIITQPSSIWARPMLNSYTDRARIKLISDNPWFRKLIEFLRAMVQLSNGRFPIALPVMHGPLDTLAAMRTPEKMCLDFIDEADQIFTILLELTELYIKLCEILLDEIPPFQGGYVTRMHLWGPGKAITPQNDTSTLISAKMYERLVMPTDRMIIKHFPYHSFHLHSSERHIIDSLLLIDELIAIQVTLEHTFGGPSLELMLPYLKRILENKPLILVVYDSETADRCLKELPATGLCLLMVPESTQGSFSPIYDHWLQEHCQPN